jgi:hypothetical protein
MEGEFDGVSSAFGSCAGHTDLVVIVLLRGMTEVPTVNTMGSPQTTFDLVVWSSRG